jgi:LAS superfamily LD-carboxypeptidase LdcB
MNVDILFGKTHEHLVQIESSKLLVHKQMLSDLLRLQRDASEAGIDLQIASAFRDYFRQLGIWNAKAHGERILLDRDEKPLEFSKLTPQEIVFSILRWSALPGCSRHHWGTDIDVFDGSTQKREEVKLTVGECSIGGPAERLHQWLGERIQSNEAYGFFRPYHSERDGIAPEPWHLSYFPVSRRMADNFTYSLFKKNIEESDVHLKEVVSNHAEEIYRRFVMNFDLP